MSREIIPPTRDENGDETHPAWGLIGVVRSSSGPHGAVLFDSDIRHQHTVVLRVTEAKRKRDLNRDWIHTGREFVEIEFSEAQWASAVSSVGSGSGVPCTIRRREDDHMVPGMPYEPRLRESVDEVRNAAAKAVREVQEAFAAYEEKKNAANLRNLRAAIANMPANVAFAAKSLSEHTENVVQRARHDIEAMVQTQAEKLGIDPATIGRPELTAGNDDTGGSE